MKTPNLAGDDDGDLLQLLLGPPHLLQLILDGGKKLSGDELPDLPINLHVESPLIPQLLRWTVCGSVPRLKAKVKTDIGASISIEAETIATITWGVHPMIRLREMEQLFSACHQYQYFSPLRLSRNAKDS